MTVIIAINIIVWELSREKSQSFGVSSLCVGVYVYVREIDN